MFRKICFAKSVLEEDEFNDLLNGRDWRALGGYLRVAWKIRWDLVNEFNF